MCVPKSLPVIAFKEQWEELDDEQRCILYDRAVAKADLMLQDQKGKTGVAILGLPQVSLMEDPKHQDPNSITVGESLARSSLVTELTILMGAGIETKDFHKYVGRGQYPKFKVEPIEGLTPEM